jgi:hypothetical protein
MIKSIIFVAGCLMAVSSTALACERHAEHVTLAEAEVTQPAPPPAVALQTPAATETKALQSLPFEPTTSLNNNPFEVDCTRNKSRQTVYYTN